MTFPILNSGWSQLGVSIYTQHNQALPPVPPLPPLLNMPGLIEGPAPMGWPPGFVAHKQATTVLVDGSPGVQQGHDIGYVIPHLALPPNALMAVNTLFSKHKVMFPVSRVLLEHKPAGTYVFFLLGAICCNPCTLPTGVVLLIKCTVWTAATVADILKGLGYIAIDVVFDLVWNKVFKGTWSGAKGTPLIPIPKIPDPAATCVLGGLTLGEMLLWGGAGLVGRWVLSQTANKAIDHVLKSWIVGPMVTGLPRGSASVGRGPVSHKFFDAKWW